MRLPLSRDERFFGIQAVRRKNADRRPSALETAASIDRGRGGKRHSWAAVGRDLVRERTEDPRGHTNRVSGASHRSRATVDLRQAGRNARDGARRGQVSRRRPWAGHVGRAGANVTRAAAAYEGRDGGGHGSKGRNAHQAEEDSKELTKHGRARYRTAATALLPRCARSFCGPQVCPVEAEPTAWELVRSTRRSTLLDSHATNALRPSGCKRSPCAPLQPGRSIVVLTRADLGSTATNWSGGAAVTTVIQNQSRVPSKITLPVSMPRSTWVLTPLPAFGVRKCAHRRVHRPRDRRATGLCRG